MKRLIANCDGLCAPQNPGGTATWGFVVQSGRQTLAAKHDVIGKGEGMTNNVAEYTSLIETLTWIRDNCPKAEYLTMRMDSLLVVNQIKGKWQVKDAKLKKLHTKAKKLIKNLKPQVNMEWVPREKNTMADALANEAYNCS